VFLLLTSKRGLGDFFRWSVHHERKVEMERDLLPVPLVPVDVAMRKRMGWPDEVVNLGNGGMTMLNLTLVGLNYMASGR
jgi:hypothetical protein